MKFAYLAAIAAFSMATPSLAVEAKLTSSVTAPNYHSAPGGLFTAFDQLVIGTTGLYSFTLSATALKGTTLASIGASIFKQGSAALASPFTFVSTQNPTSSFSTIATTLQAGTYQIAWTGLSQGGKTTATLTANAVTPVPGPEAGAGLGALAMLGVAYLAKRRRDEKAAAA